MATPIITWQEHFPPAQGEVTLLLFFYWLYLLTAGSLLSGPVVTQGTSLFQNTGET